MNKRIERFISMAFEDWKKENTAPEGHPDEEEIACFLEGKLSEEEAERFRRHVACCDECAGLLAAGLFSYPPGYIDVPAHALDKAKAMVSDSGLLQPMDIALRLVDFGLEVIKVSGDILFGQEFIPAAVLRSRNITQFKDEIVAVKDFPDARLEVKARAGKNAQFGLVVSVKDKKTQSPLPELRITLLKDGIELESKVTDKGKAAFEHLACGHYDVAVVGQKKDIARIAIDVKA